MKLKLGFYRGYLCSSSPPPDINATALRFSRLEQRSAAKEVRQHAEAERRDGSREKVGDYRD